ncbi:MAG: hypothetical protein KBT66_11275 [Amphritea sp.]|nr:hypothetical protein [Amphritea sp.]MBQ0784804.1 hypothetical protein [Amphritea sp.]
MSLKKLTLIAAIAATLATPIAQADAGVGAGITYVFGQGFAVGVKVFTNDEEDKGVGSFGLDYMLGSGAWRPNVGVGYLGDSIYGDVNAGYNYQTGGWTFGVGAGGADTEDKTTAPAPVDPDAAKF